MKVPVLIIQCPCGSVDCEEIIDIARTDLPKSRLTPNAVIEFREYIKARHILTQYQDLQEDLKIAIAQGAE